MAQAHIQLKGREALQRKLNERRERMLAYLNMRLLQLAEDAVVYSMENKGYKDRTANLKNSISFALYLDGKLVTAKAGEYQSQTKRQKASKVLKMRSRRLLNKKALLPLKGIR